MTFRNLLPAFVLGLVLGVVVTKSLPPSKIDSAPSKRQSAKSTAGSESEASPSSLSSDSPTSYSVPPAGSFRGSLEELFELIGSPYSEGNSVDSLLVLESLTERQVITFLDEIDASYFNSRRGYEPRTALLRRWVSLAPERALSAILARSRFYGRETELERAISAIASEDAELAIKLARGLPTDSDKKRALGTIAASIASQDPERAFELLSQSGTRTPRAFSKVFQAWMEKDPTAAMEAVKKVEERQGSQEALGAVADFLVRLSPEKAWAYALTLNGNSQLIVNNQIFSQLALDNPQQATLFIAQMPKGRNRDSAIVRLASAWMDDNPRESRMWIKTLPKNEQGKALEQSLSNIAPEEIEETMRLVESLKPSPQNTNLYGTLAGRWAESDPEAVQVWLQRLPAGSARESAQKGILSTLSHSDPVKAMDFIESLEITAQNRSEISNVAASMALEEPEATFAWLDSLKDDGGEHEKLFGDIITQLASYGSSGVASHVLKIEDAPTRKKAISNLLANWGNQDHQAAKAWVDSHLEAEEKLGAYSRLVGVVSSGDPLAAKNLFTEVSQGLSPEEVDKNFNGVMKQIARSWGWHDPDAAAAWVQTQPDNDSRHWAVAAVVDRWLDADSTAAANFVLTLDEGPERDLAVRSITLKLSSTDPESAFHWANSITDETRRQRQIRGTIGSWKQSDPEAARKAVLSSNLSEETRDKILESLESE